MASDLKHALPSYNEIAKGMHFWKTIQGNENVEPKIYFDSAGIIDMLTGTSSVFKGNAFQKYLYEQPSNLVYALAYRRWLGDIYMLPPHTEEFIDRLSFNERLFPQHPSEENQNQREDLWGRLLNTSDLKELRSLIGEKKIMDKEVIDEIQRHPYHIFLGLYLTSGKNYWKYRYKDIVKDRQILKFSHETDYEFGDVTNSPLFKKVNHLLNIKRARTANNYIDAIALCILDEKLQKVKNQSGVKVGLPLFFSNQDHILETVRELSKEPIEENGRKPFLYYDEKTKEYFPIVRKASFFIIEGFVNAMRENNNLDAIIELEGILNKIIDEVKSLKQEKNSSRAVQKVNTEYLEPDLHEKVMLEFFDRWWKGNGADEIMKELELKYDYTEGLDQQIHQQIEEDRSRLQSKIKGFGPRIKIIRDAWHSFIGLSNYIQDRYIEPKATSDAFNEFGPRYNFSEKVCSKIQHWVDRAIEIVESEDSQELRSLEAEVVSDLIDGLFERRGEQFLDDKAKNERLDKLAASIGFFFFFERFPVVQDACDIIRDRFEELSNTEGDKYPTPSIALIHAASVFKGQHFPQEKAEERALSIIECVEQKAITNYKVWIGLSYIYNLLWEHRIKKFKFRELFDPKEFFEIILKSKGYEYLICGIDYSKKAVDYLENLFIEDNDETKLKQRRRKYYYALNNYLFFKTLYTSPEEFKTLDNIREKLEEIDYDPEYFQEDRFSDTLSRYYFRSAILAEDKKYFELDIEDAISFNERSTKSSSRGLYKNLNRLLKRWKFEKRYQGAKDQLKYFNRNSPEKEIK